MKEAKYQVRKHLSISTLSKFALCPRKYFLNAHGLITEGVKGAFLFGEAMHMAFPMILSGKTVEDAWQNGFMKIWDENLADKKRNAENALLILADFANSHGVTHTGFNKGLYKIVLPEAEANLELSERVSEYELAFAIDIGLSVPLVGRLDGVCRHRDTNELWVLEFKTTGGDPYGNLSDNFLRGFDKNPQTIGYPTILKLGMDEVIRGTILDATLVSARKQDNVQYPIYVSEDESKHFIKWAQFYGAMLLEMEKQYLESLDVSNFPQFFTGCHPYAAFGSGGFTCDYKIICDQEDYRSLLGAFEVSEKQGFVLKPKDNQGASNASCTVEGKTQETSK